MNEPLATSAPISTRVSPDQPTFVSIFGKKGSGKSVLARAFWDTWPGDQLCIDITRDALTGADVQQTFTDPPDSWPAPAREGEPVRIRYTPNAKSKRFADDLDRAIGLSALRKRSGGCLIWVDEIAIASKASANRPYLRHLLVAGRHDRTSALFCGPRPIDIDTLVLPQSDLVYVFELPNPGDRRRIADSCGIAPALFDEAVHALPKGGHEYLRWDGVELVQFPPIPMRRLRPPGRDHDLDHDA